MGTWPSHIEKASSDSVNSVESVFFFLYHDTRGWQQDDNKGYPTPLMIFHYNLDYHFENFDIQANLADHLRGYVLFM